MVVWAFVWLGLAGLYLVLSGDVGLVESTASVLCATAGTWLAVLLARLHGTSRLSGRPAPRGVLRPIAKLLPETIAVGRQLVGAIFFFKDQRGAYVRQPFAPGGDDPVSAGRRAAVVLGISLAPGSFVIRGERTDTLILHTLPQTPPSADSIWPA